MKIKIMILSLGLVSAGFSLDEYQPIAPNKLEVDLGFNPNIASGSMTVLTDGVAVYPINASPLVNFNAQIKYGIISGLDIEAGWVFSDVTTDATGSQNGLLQPDVAVKYALTNLGVGFFVDAVLPYATGDFAPSPHVGDLGFAPGVIYGKNYGSFQAVGLASYLINIKNSDEYQAGNVLTVYLKPGYWLTDAFSAYLGLKYQMFSDVKIDGTDADNSNGHVFTIQPGLSYKQSEKVSYDLSVPVLSSEIGSKTLTSFGIAASGSLTFF